MSLPSSVSAIALRPLHDAIAATAQSDPARMALQGDGGCVTYGELRTALPAAAGQDPRRTSLAMTGTVQDVVQLLAESCAGQSVLVLDGRGTSWEQERARGVFGDGEGPSVPVMGLCTSGTNGLPKVVELDWESALRNAASFAAAIRYEPGDVIWVTTPLPHLYGLAAGVIAGLLRGATIVISGGALGPEEFGDRLVGEGISVLLSVPFLVRQYVQELRRESRLVRASRLRATIAAGEPVAEELIAAWREVTGTPLHAHYGLTEGGHVTLASGQPGEGVGRPLPDVEIDIGAGGSVRVRRRAPARPYRVIGEDPDPEGWCVTGDLGRIDPAGNLHIVGREGDRINVAGKKVDPSEVEHALRSCAAVADCAVAGLRRAEGEQIVAFVTGADAVSDAQLRTELGKLLSAYKVPRRFVRVEQIPRTLTGKVRRGQLIAALENRPAHSQTEDSQR